MTGRRSHRAASGCSWSSYLVYVLLLLPHDAALVVPFAALVLGACYGTSIAEVISSRWVVARIVGDTTSRRLADLGSQIDALMDRVPGLSPEDERELDQLPKAYEDMRQAPRTIAPSQALGRVVTTALVRTLTFVALAAAEGYIGRLLDRVLDWLEG